MVQMSDTEGEKIPEGLFDLDLSGTGILTINVPEYCNIDDETYDSCGVLTVRLDEVFDEYLRNYQEFDGGEHLPELAKMLRNYANKFDAETEKLGREELPK